MKTPALFAIVITLGLRPLGAAPEARITHLAKEVKLLHAKDAPRRAALNEVVSDGTAVETGAGAQTELTFGDQTQTRLAAGSVFDFQGGTRRMNLARGAILVHAPKGTNARVATANVISVLSGTTSVLEYYPKGYIKLIVLEGTARMFMPGKIGESVLVNAGQLLMFHAVPAPSALPNPVDIDLKRMMATSQLIKGFAPLGSEASIAAGMRDQSKQKSSGALADTNLVIFGRGTLVSLVPPDSTAKNSPAPAPSPVKTATPHP